MKQLGTTFEYEKERNRDLIRAYRICMDAYPGLPFFQQCKLISNMPASRFWVSEERASIVISRLLKGEDIHLTPLKQEMYNEILERTKTIMKREPHRAVSEIVFDVVGQPAPKFYYSAATVREMIYRIKREWYEARKRKLRHLF
jgi:hypothetical protein